MKSTRASRQTDAPFTKFKSHSFEWLLNAIRNSLSLKVLAYTHKVHADQIRKHLTLIGFALVTGGLYPGDYKTVWAKFNYDYLKSLSPEQANEEFQTCLRFVISKKITLQDLCQRYPNILNDALQQEFVKQSSVLLGTEPKTLEHYLLSNFELNFQEYQSVHQSNPGSLKRAREEVEADTERPAKRPHSFFTSPEYLEMQKVYMAKLDEKERKFSSSDFFADVEDESAQTMDAHRTSTTTLEMNDWLDLEGGYKHR